MIEFRGSCFRLGNVSDRRAMDLDNAIRFELATAMLADDRGVLDFLSAIGACFHIVFLIRTSPPKHFSDKRMLDRTGKPIG